MKVLELFAGSRSIGKVAEELGYEVFSTDVNNFDGIDYVVDILNFDINKIPFAPDIVWASPPCTAFTVARIGINWHKDHTPKTEKAKFGLKLVEKTLEIINKINPKYGNIKSYIKRCKRILNGEISTNISPTECLDIINNTLISLEEEHEKFITEVKHKIK